MYRAYTLARYHWTSSSSLDVL